MEREIEIPISYGDARKMITVATAASRQAERGTLSSNHRRVLEVVGQELSETLPSEGGELFGVRKGESPAGSLSLERSTFQAYLKTLDWVATQTPKPHVRNTCQTLCSRLIADLNVDALGLQMEQYRTLEIQQRTVF